jgi:hypothetical protein
MSNSTATVTTDRPQRYGKQLVSHLSRRSEGTWDDQAQTGFIQFGSGRVDLSCSDDALLLSLVTDDSDLDQLEDVVGRHLVRFGTRDELIVSWVRLDGTAGTEQRVE